MLGLQCTAVCGNSICIKETILTLGRSEIPETRR